MTSFIFTSVDGTTVVELLTDLIGYKEGSENLTVCQVTNHGTLNAAAQLVIRTFTREKHTASFIRLFAAANNLVLNAIPVGRNDAKILGALFTPTNLVGTPNSATQITLTWTKSASATGYVTQRATNAAFTTGLVTTTLGDVATQVVTGLVTATPYFFRIKAIAPAVLPVGIESGYTANATATTS